MGAIEDKNSVMGGSSQILVETDAGLALQDLPVESLAELSHSQTIEVVAIFTHSSSIRQEFPIFLLLLVVVDGPGNLPVSLTLQPLS